MKSEYHKAIVKKQEKNIEEEIDMEEKKSNQVVGFIFLGLGAVLALNSILKITSVVFFHGWWTLLIIVPSVYSMFKNGVNKKNVTGAVVGGLLLLNARTHFIGFITGKLFLPLIMVAIGVKFLSKR